MRLRPVSLDLGLCLALAACSGGTGRTPTSAPGENETSAAVSSVRVGKGTVEERIVSYGTVEFAADRQRTVPFLNAGQLTQVPVVAGQAVEQGDELLRVGPIPKGAPRVQQASIDAEFAARELARTRRMVSQKLATNQDLQNAERQLLAAQAALRALGGARPGGTVMRAPSDGIVARVLVHRGDVVQAGDPAIVLAARDAMSVRVGFEVEDLPRLTEGLSVRIAPVYAGSDQQLASATLSTLHRVVDPKTQLVEGIIRVDSTPGWMAAGMVAKVVVIVQAHRDALYVPRAALIERAGQAGVFVIEREHAHFRALELGIGDESRVEVLAGLTPGSRVVTTGRTSLEEGMAVRDQADTGTP